eukprot:TRINITY_DN931_c0_g2_i1.p1 TRINITY_DN931_c0_g2~~TRINITY_DN931_c0_g2_i1.p1  ORF type:complete len:453 (+),score=50.02 TRINITY_DN931_c0_g2_i1:277-1635(+)
MLGFEHLNVQAGNSVLIINGSLGIVPLLVHNQLGSDQMPENALTIVGLYHRGLPWLSAMLGRYPVNYISESGTLRISSKNCFHLTYPAFDRVLVCGTTSKDNIGDLSRYVKPDGVFVGFIENTFSEPRMICQIGPSTSTLTLITTPKICRDIRISRLEQLELETEYADLVRSTLPATETKTWNNSIEFLHWVRFFQGKYEVDLRDCQRGLDNLGYSDSLLKEGRVSREALVAAGIPPAKAGLIQLMISKYAEISAKKATLDEKLFRHTRMLCCQITKVDLSILHISYQEGKFSAVLKIVLKLPYPTEKPGNGQLRTVRTSELSETPLLNFKNGPNVELHDESAQVNDTMKFALYKSEYSGEFSELMELNWFPFDSQLLQIVVENSNQKQPFLSLDWQIETKPVVGYRCQDEEWDIPEVTETEVPVDIQIIKGKQLKFIGKAESQCSSLLTLY